MLDPRIRQLTSNAEAVAAARTVTTPDEVERFEEIARETEAGREYLSSDEWRSYRAVIASRAAEPTRHRPVGITFSEALHIARAGGHIARASWPEGSYVTAQAGYPNGIPINQNTAAATGLRLGTPAVFRPYLMRCFANDPVAAQLGITDRYVFLPWTPGQDDLFAEDWCIVDRERADPPP